MIISGMLVGGSMIAFGAAAPESCRAFDNLDHLPDRFVEITRANFGTFDAATYTDDVCTCDGYPGALKIYLRSIGLQSTGDIEFSCVASTDADRKSH